MIEGFLQIDGGSRWHAAGYVRYEAAAAFGLDVRQASCDMPLVWFALFEPSKVHELGCRRPGPITLERSPRRSSGTPSG